MGPKDPSKKKGETEGGTQKQKESERKGRELRELPHPERRREEVVGK